MSELAASGSSGGEALEPWLDAVGIRWDADAVVIAVRGDDARSWLNGQTTSDLRKLTSDRGVYGLVLTNKGRIVSDLLSFEREGELHFVVPRASWATLEGRLEKYIIMEDVELEEAPLGVVSLLGARQGELDVDAALAGLGATVFGHARLGEGREVVVARDRVEEAVTRLLEAALPLGGVRVEPASFERARIRAGVPRWPEDFGEKTYPQEAGLKRAVAFDKGCYLGQEVVCTLENRGQLTRLLVALEVPEGTPAGAELTADGKPAGELTSVAGSSALGFVKRAFAEEGLSLEAPSGAARVLRAIG